MKLALLFVSAQSKESFVVLLQFYQYMQTVASIEHRVRIIYRDYLLGSSDDLRIPFH